MITRVNPGFLQIDPIYEFCDLAGNSHIDNGYFHEKLKKTYIG